MCRLLSERLHTHTVVIPAKAGIQYMPAGAIEPQHHGVLDTPLEPVIGLAERRDPVAEYDEECVLRSQNNSCFARDSEKPRRSALKQVMPVCSEVQVKPPRCQTSP
jgi:hypothetical protein